MFSEMRDYAAPELENGEEPTSRSDVFSLGLLADELFTGQTLPAALARVISKATEARAEDRYADAALFQRDFNKAVAESSLLPATAAEAARFVASPTATSTGNVEAALAGLEDEDSSELAVDDVLADLAGEESGPGKPSGRRFPRASGGGGNKAVMESILEPERQESAAIKKAREAAEKAAAAAAAELANEVVEEHTEVTSVDDVDALMAEQRDPISEIIALDSKLQISAVGEDDLDERDVVEDAAVAAQAGKAVDSLLDDFDDADAGSDDEESEAADEDELAGAEATEPEPKKASAGPDPLEDFEVPEPLKKGGSSLMWFGAATLILGLGFGYLYTQTDVFHPERAQAKLDQQKRANQKLEEELRAKLDKPGTVVVESDVADAAVWLLLGKAPLDTVKLPASETSDFRFMLEGHEPLDVPLTSTYWVGQGDKLEANLHARLVKGELEGAMPAFPPDPEKKPPPGPEGKGIVHVESTPPGAQVWLLVGFTPRVPLSGVPAGKDYEFMVLKDGFEPSESKFRAADWYLSGVPGQGEVRGELSQQVALKELPKAPKRNRKRNK
jgi:hypothetical protein